MTKAIELPKKSPEKGTHVNRRKEGRVPPYRLVTGGNAGIGYERCKGVLKAGFYFVACARSHEKVDVAAASLLQDGPELSMPESLVLDLASLKSVRDAATAFLVTKRPLKVCVPNSDIMAPRWEMTCDLGGEPESRSGRCGPVA